jgi:hypothetical protein
MSRRLLVQNEFLDGKKEYIIPDYVIKIRRGVTSSRLYIGDSD